MVQTVTTIVLTAGSVLLLGYWFRYTCLLILSAKTTRDFAGEVAEANQLSFLEVQAQLRAGDAGNLDQLDTALDRDYERLMKLMGSHEAQIEDSMLRFNYRLTRVWYRTSRHFSPSVARNALDEMSMIVSHFANSMGERACAAA